MKKRRKGILWIIMILLAVGSMILFGVNKVQKEKELLSWLEQEEYNGIWCFMHEMPGYSEENYLTYIGKKIIQRDESIKKLKEISRCMEVAFLNQPDMSAVYLELDPELIWKESFKNQEKWQENLEKYLLYQVDNHPETQFDIILSHPRLEYWTKHKEDKIDELLLLYYSFVQTVENRSNLRVFYLGDQEWIVSNKDNYSNTYSLDEEMGKYIYLSTFCDGLYQVHSQDLLERQAEFKKLILREQECPTEYPDLSEYTVVFLGDSIYAMDRRSTSIPGVVKAFSGANVYNIGEGGLSATFVEEKPSFVTKVNALESGRIPDDLKELGVAAELERFLDCDTDDKKLLFVINYGLNDYFQGERLINEKDSYDINTYSGAMRKGITMLQRLYPQADIIVMSATYVSDWAEGNEYTGEHGGRLMEYIDASEAVAKECGVYFKNCYLDLAIDSRNAERYMQDSCHFNAQGRLLYGKQLIDFIDKSISKNN